MRRFYVNYPKQPLLLVWYVLAIVTVSKDLGILLKWGRWRADTALEVCAEEKLSLVAHSTPAEYEDQ